MYYAFFAPQSIDRNLGWFSALAVENSAAIDMNVQASLGMLM